MIFVITSSIIINPIADFIFLFVLILSFCIKEEEYVNRRDFHILAKV